MDRVKKVIRMVILSAIHAALVLGVEFAWLTMRSITGPIRQVTEGLEDAAESEGDLTKRHRPFRLEKRPALAGLNAKSRPAMACNWR
jgi:methyl-accepting chemotaxis protein